MVKRPNVGLFYVQIKNPLALAKGLSDFTFFLFCTNRSETEPEMRGERPRGKRDSNAGTEVG